MVYQPPDQSLLLAKLPRCMNSKTWAPSLLVLLTLQVPFSETHSFLHVLSPKKSASDWRRMQQEPVQQMKLIFERFRSLEHETKRYHERVDKLFDKLMSKPETTPALESEPDTDSAHNDATKMQSADFNSFNSEQMPKRNHASTAVRDIPNATTLSRPIGGSGKRRPPPALTGLTPAHSFARRVSGNDNKLPRKKMAPVALRARDNTPRLTRGGRAE